MSIELVSEAEQNDFRVLKILNDDAGSVLKLKSPLSDYTFDLKVPENEVGQLITNKKPIVQGTLVNVSGLCFSGHNHPECSSIKRSPNEAFNFCAKSISSDVPDRGYLVIEGEITDREHPHAGPAKVSVRNVKTQDLLRGGVNYGQSGKPVTQLSSVNLFVDGVKENRPGVFVEVIKEPAC